jgi:transposase
MADLDVELAEYLDILGLQVQAVWQEEDLVVVFNRPKDEHLDYPQLRETIRKVKRGSLIYTDKFKSYDGLVMYGFKHERIDKSVKFANGKVYINGIEGFWSYAKERLLKFHGVSKANFIYYLKELEFRYNFRDNIDDSLYKCLGGIN